MKKFLFVLLLTACSSSMVRMTPAETEALMQKHPETLEALKMVEDSSYRDYSHNYLNIENDSCSKVECRGIHAELKCWKTPVDMNTCLAAARPTMPKGREGMSEHREACLEGKNEGPPIRISCFNYLQGGMTEANHEFYQQVMDHICDMRQVKCSRNGKSFGSGSLRMQNTRLMSDIFRITKDGAVDTYLVVVGRE